LIVLYDDNCHQSHLTNNDEPYKCLSVSEELSFCFKHREAETDRSVKKFTRYSEAELRPENKDKLDISRN